MGRHAPAVVAACALLLGGCGEDQSALDPRSDASRAIATLWWWMFAVACVVLGGALLLLGLAWLRRRSPGFPLIGRSEGLASGLVVTFGIVIPAIALIGLFTVANFVVANETDRPDPASTPMTIEVVGHQWWWEVRYPGAAAVTANEIHIPTHTRVAIVARTGDVIHSFWVPQLNRKVDTIPGQRNRVLLEAGEPGRYRGQCAEFCGAAHSQMGMYVDAQPPEEFRAWLDAMAAPAQPPGADAERRGRDVFLAAGCASCHTIRGTPASGRIGPDLTHVRSRETLAALTIPNDAAHLADWIRDPQHVKPGNRMPDLHLGQRELGDVVAYLESLR